MMRPLLRATNPGRNSRVNAADATELTWIAALNEIDESQFKHEALRFAASVMGLEPE